jgi:hypothetical protein
MRCAWRWGDAAMFERPHHLRIAQILQSLALQGVPGQARHDSLNWLSLRT